MIRTARYSMSVAAAVLVLAAGAWWVLFSQRNAWGQAMDRLTQIRSATCMLRTHRGGVTEASKTYLAGSRLRAENPGGFYVIDLLEGKEILADMPSKTGRIVDLKKQPDEWTALGSNPLNDLVDMRNARAERLPEEHVDGTTCQVYRVTDIAFMGYKVPWVKLWLDPQSKLPVQIHSVVADRCEMTFNDFHWNEPIDRSLLELALPDGYKLVGGPKATTAAAPPQPSATSPHSTEATKEAGSAETGREIPTEEIAKTLDMLGQRIDTNYKAIVSWSGTFDVKTHNNVPVPPPLRGKGDRRYYEEISYVAVHFFAEPGAGRLRINNRPVEPTRIISDTNIKPACALPESRWLRTSKDLLRFPVSDLVHTVEGFPRIEGLGDKPFRVLYREPPKAGEQYVAQGYLDPPSFFGHGHLYSETCSRWVDAFRGKRRNLTEYAKGNVKLRVRRTKTDSEYVLTQRMKPAESQMFFELVFSSAAGFNVVSNEFRQQEQSIHTIRYTFRKEKGILIPTVVEKKRPWEGSTVQSPMEHQICTLRETQVNEPIDPAVFTIQSIGLHYGDRVADRIENEMFIFDGKELVPANKFKLQAAADVPNGDR
ncbi:MAG: hypothetical protein ACLQNE_34205 [Thermoguttaceae bacterium]